MFLSLIITTFDRPDALAFVLASLERQSDLPDELVIADDGSGPATRELIERFRRRFPRRILHAWQPHDGYRLCRVRNLALARASGDYVVQLDGDMVLHREFIADHRRAARPGCWVQGTRILLDEKRTRALLPEGSPALGPFAAGLGFKRRLYAFHLPRLSPALRAAANVVIAIKGCNQGFWRADLERVNGYNEDMTGWGWEDKELAARLAHAGVRRTTLLFGGIAYHLHHRPASRDSRAGNAGILRETLRQRRIRCALGLDRHRAQPARAL